MHSPDDDLRRAFDELRAADASRTPPFRRVWNAAAQRAARRPRRAWRLAMASLVVALVAGVILLVPRREPQPIAIPAQWHGPTDFLLATPGSDLLRDVPELAPSVPDYSQKGRTR